MLKHKGILLEYQLMIFVEPTPSFRPVISKNSTIIFERMLDDNSRNDTCEDLMVDFSKN